MRDGWVKTKLGLVSEFVMGQAPLGERCNKEGIGTPFVKAGEFEENRPKIVEWTTDPLKIAKSSDVLVCVVGATAGKINLGADCAIGRSVAAIRPGEKLHQLYLYYLLSLELSNLRSGSRGSAQGVITKDDLHRIVVFLPPILEQKRIVDLISSVDSYVEALEHQLGSVRSASNAHLEKIVSAFSDDWREVTLGEVLEISRGGSPRPIQEYLTDSEDGINWVKIADATRSEKYIYSTLQKIKREGIFRSREVFSGDFVLSNSMSFGRPYIMRTDGCIHDGWLLLSKVSNNFDEDFLYNLLNSDYVQRQFESLAAGSGVRNLNIEVVKKVKVKVPAIHVQKELASVINEFDNFIIKLTKQLHSGFDLRKALLSDLLSGTHEIPASYDKVIGAA